MKKSFSSSLVLSLLLAVLLGWYFIYEKKIRPENKEAEEKEKLLSTLKPSEIQFLTVLKLKPGTEKNPEYQTVELKKTGADWSLTLPIEYPADSSTLSNILNTLTTTKQDRIVDDNPKDLETFGLKTPYIKVIAKRESSTAAEEIWIGNNTPVGYSAYVKIANKPAVYKVGQTFRSTFDKTVTDYRDKDILHLTRSDISELEIVAPKGTLLAKKEDSKGSDQWILPRIGAPAESGEMNNVLNTLTDMRAISFASEKAKDLSVFGLQTPTIKVSLKKTKDQSRVSLKVGKAKEKFYVKVDGKDPVFEIEKNIFEKLNIDSDKVLDKAMARFNRFDLKRIKIIKGTDLIELEKNDGKWVFAKDSEHKVDQARVDDYVTKLQDTRLEKYLKSSEAPKTAKLTIQLFEGKDEQPETEKVSLTFGDVENKFVKTSRAGLAIPFTIKEEDWKKLVIVKTQFVDSTPAQPKKEDKKS